MPKLARIVIPIDAPTLTIVPERMRFNPDERSVA